ncbi:hypothetical protein Sango_0670500 [Sesamum angolense]|uniref:Reverse transcriptase domain-containing protein n=1 Tax=Sesamum angolense TaxID=2727404 RepID=A0AAE2C2T4_9LAMI|nr:hypothetical protein Sango_0670500 [Sesamum angolense]
MDIRPCRTFGAGCSPKIFPIQFFDRKALFSIARLLGTPLRTDVSTATLVRSSVARVCIEINLLKPLQIEIGLDFGTEVLIQPVIYERIPKYYGTYKHLEHTEDECYEKFKSKGPVRPRAQRELHTRRKGKLVVFEDVEGHPEASSSGAKGTENGGVEVELHDTVLPTEMPEPSYMGRLWMAERRRTFQFLKVHRMSVRQLRMLPHAESCVVPPALDLRVEQPVCVENLIPNTADATLCPPGEGILQIDTEDVTSRLARHQWGRSLGDEPGAHSVSSNRGNVVSLPHRIVTRISVGASPWILGGDFNTVLSPNERSGGSTPSRIAMSDFHDAIADSALVDAGYVRSPYTWYSRRLSQRLDRVLISSCWMIVFPKMQVTHLELSQSNNHGLLVETEYTVERKVSSFRFQHMWTMHSKFLGVIRRNWQYPMSLGMCLIKWQRRSDGSRKLIRHMIRIPTTAHLWSEIGVLLSWFGFWPKRRLFGGRKRHDGEYLTDPIAIKDSATSFFQRLLTAEPVFSEEMDSEHLEDGLTDEDRRSLCVMPTLEEVREAVFSIDPDSVAGPDEFGAVFFHTCWEIIFKDVFGTVIEFFRGSGFVPGRLLSDNVLLAQELVHSLESRRPEANVVFKLDMAKAYDRVSWEFLYQVLGQKGFLQH